MMGMAELTQEEKQKIYEEEKARIASEDSPVSEIDKKQRRAKLLTYFSLSALILLIIYGFYIIIAAPNVLSPADNLKLANYRLNLAKGILNNLDEARSATKDIEAFVQKHPKMKSSDLGDGASVLLDAAESWRDLEDGQNSRYKNSAEVYLLFLDMYPSNQKAPEIRRWLKVNGY